jgi:hypothetical protein
VLWYLLHDNAPAHSSGVVSEIFCEMTDPRVIPSTLLSRSDARRLSFISYIKNLMKWARFQVVPPILQIVTREIMALQERASSVFDSLYGRNKRCAKVGVAILSKKTNKTNSVAFSPQANYTD